MAKTDTSTFHAPVTQITTTWTRSRISYWIRYGETGKWFPMSRAEAEKRLVNRTGFTFVETQTGACE